MHLMRCIHCSRRRLPFLAPSASTPFSRKLRMIALPTHDAFVCVCVCVWSMWVSNDAAKCYASSAFGRRQRRRHVRPYIRVGLGALSVLPGIALVRITATPSLTVSEQHRVSVRDGAHGNRWRWRCAKSPSSRELV